MNQLRLTWLVAHWEVERLFKLRDLVVTLLVTVLLGAGYLGVKALWDYSRVSKARVVALNAERLTFQLPPGSGIELVTVESQDEAALRAAVGRKELDGLLILRNPDEAELLVTKRPHWLDELNAALSAARQAARLQSANLSPPELAAIVAPFQLNLRYHETGGKPFETGEIITAAIVTGLLLMGVILGSSYLLVGVTGEKQLRVTEQIISAIPPQVWIDGKILGHAALTLVSMVNLGIGFLLSNLILNAFGGGAGVTLPLALSNPLLLISFCIQALLGFFFWFSFFAALAATINDPNTSARSSFLFLPFLPLSVGFIGLAGDPDTWVMKALGLFPLTAPSVMFVRLVVTRVAAWEFLLSAGLLLGAIWLMRRAAGKIFALGILLSGKEPGWREMWRWTKKA
jgi:ABC-2 type transport system permease protein